MTEIRLADFIQAFKRELAESEHRGAAARARGDGSEGPSLRFLEATAEITVRAQATNTREGNLATGKAIEIFVSGGLKDSRGTTDEAIHKVSIKLAPEEEIFLGERHSGREKA